MRLAVFVLVLFWAGRLLADEDWQKTLTPPTPGNFPPLRPLTADYTFGWSALTAATVQTMYSQTKEGLLELHVTGQSVGAVRALWKMNSDSTSLVEPKTLRPVKLVQQETYSDESRITTVVFTPEAAERTRDTKPADKDSGKTKKFKFAPLFDMHSALLFIRSLPLEPGNDIRFVTYPAASAYLTDIDVLGRETVKIGRNKRPAIKLGIRLKAISKDMKLESHKKFKRATAWISDDADRLLLKIEAEVMVGKVWMELQKVQFGSE